MAVRIGEVNAGGISLAAADFDAGVFQCCFDARQFPGDEPQRHMIHFAACVNLFSVFDFKECDALVAALEKALPGALMIDVHTEEIDIKLL